jgi:hypothetical protein
MLAEWKLEPDTAQRLVYRNGSLTPVGGVADVSGFAGLARMFGGRMRHKRRITLVGALVLIALAAFVWRNAAREGVYKFSARYLARVLLGVRGVCLAGVASSVSPNCRNAARRAAARAYVSRAGAAGGQRASVEVRNIEDKTSVWSWSGWIWPRSSR